MPHSSAIPALTSRLEPGLQVLLAARAIRGALCRTPNFLPRPDRTLAHVRHLESDSYDPWKQESQIPSTHVCKATRADTHALEESDRAILSMNQTNKEEQSSAEPGEKRVRAKENIVPFNTRPTQCEEVECTRD